MLRHALTQFAQGHVGLPRDLGPKEGLTDVERTGGPMARRESRATVGRLPAIPPLFDGGLAEAKAFGNFSLGFIACFEGRDDAFT